MRVAGSRQGIDEDHFDARCEHLLVRESDTGKVIASATAAPSLAFI